MILVVEPQHLRFIRALRVEWSWCESGAPSFSLLPVGSTRQDVLARLREVTGTSLDDAVSLTSFYRECTLAAEAYVRNAELTPGRYEYESPLGLAQLMQEPFAKSNLVEIQGRTIRTEVTSAQLALLRHANVRFFDNGEHDCFAAVDPKRPYGDMTYFYLDMARILGVEPEGQTREDEPSLREFTSFQLGWLDAMHHATEPALQILLQRGEFRLGQFRREPPDYGYWIARD